MAEVNIAPGSGPFLSSLINELASMSILQRPYVLALVYSDIDRGKSCFFHSAKDLKASHLCLSKV